MSQFSRINQTLISLLYSDLFDQLNSENLSVNLDRKDIYENLQHFKDNYWPTASLMTHLDFVNKIGSFRDSNNGQFPTKKQFYLMFRNSCFCRYYISDEDIFVRTADFFMRQFGDISSLSCSNVYYFSEFYMLERRDPVNLIELNSYISRTIIADIAPNFFDSGAVSNPVEQSKIDKLKNRIFTFTYSFKGCDVKEDDKEVCSICQDDIEDSQKCIRLECGHYFHGDESNCCENGSIFRWFENNNSCPMCRTEV